MKLKEINNKIAHIAFSPLNIYPSYIASGTAAEQTDSSFNKPTLDLYKLDLSNPNIDLELCGYVETESRFSKLIWTDYTSSNAKNVIIGGCENSKIYLYNYEKILNKQTSIVQVLEKHTGNVSALDINPFQNNLLASSASQSDIFIWDMNNPTTPMTPGARLQPLDDINCVAWNHQVQHILASCSSGKCVVWDLRKNESIIKVSDTMSKMKAKLVAWHPDIATQMCLSSDDDNSPYLQIWDLRFATSPVRILEGHQRGILNLQWCSSDSNLLVSTGKDSRLLCWNPNNPTSNGEILFDLTTVGQWCFDLSLSKRNPDLVCTSSFEGQVNVYSLMGGKYNVTHQTSSKIMDSFGVDGAGNMPGSPTNMPQNTTQIVQPLKLAPKWMKKSCGARFAFGGKLVSFGKYAADISHVTSEQLRPTTPSQVSNQRVVISQVVTDNELVEKSNNLENALQNGNVIEYCNYKIENAINQNQASVWRFILASFNQNRNEKYLELLGFNNKNLDDELKGLLKNEHNLNNNHQNGIENNEKTNLLNNQLNNLNLNNGSIFDNIKQTEENLNNDDTFNDIARSVSPVNLRYKNETENLITELLLLGRYEAVVDLLVQEDRFTEAILIANFFDKNLLLKTQQKYFRHFNKNKFSNLLEKLLNRNWSGIITTCNLEHWKEALATIMTYTSGNEQLDLCDQLGKRLEDDRTDETLINACVCYICSGNLENLVNCWQKVLGETDADTSSNLQDMIEKVMILKFCFHNVHPDLSKKLDQSQSLHKLNSKLVKYAKLLADQGCFVNAYSYINDSNDQSILLLKDRLYHLIDPSMIQRFRLRKPEHPFKSTQQTTQAKSNVASNLSHLQTNRKHLSQFGHSNSATNQQQFQASFNPYNNTVTSNNQTQNITANNLNTPFLPVSSVNHPMPISNIYPTQDLTQRSATPVKSFVQQPPPPPSSTSNVSNLNANQSVFNPTLQQQKQQQTLSQPPTSQQFFTPQAQSQTQSSNVSQQPAIQSFMHAKPATAWNDPPIVAPKIKQTQPVKEIEKPVFFQPRMPTQLPSQTNQFYQPQQQTYQQTYQQYQPQVQTSQTYDFNQTQQQFQPSVASVQPQQNVQQVQVVEKPAPVEKGPIPVEHQDIQIVFDSLLQKCLSATNVPATKRKLEDVAKKLEILYDKLRDSTLSANVIQGLHSMIQYIKAFDYQSTLQLHTNIVGTSNFSEISGFMPGVKVLIQSCQQMNINF